MKTEILLKTLLMTNQPENWPENIFVPAALPASWMAYVVDHNLPQDLILEAADLTNEHASSFAAGISMEKLRRLLTAIYSHSRDDGMGFEVGLRMPPTSFGSLGNALIASPDLRAALDTLIKYWGLLVKGIRMDLCIDGDVCKLTLFAEEYLDGPMRNITIDAFVASLFRGATAMVPEIAHTSELWLDRPTPTNDHSFLSLIKHWRFNMPLIQCRFPATLLDTPLPLASPTGEREALQQCENQAHLLRLHKEVSGRIQQRIGYQADGYPTLETVSKTLGMTSRTLRRKLHAEGVNYSSLIENARLADAITMLESPELGISRISEILDYSDAANFTRAFRKKTGFSPSKYRSMLAKD